MRSPLRHGAIFKVTKTKQWQWRTHKENTVVESVAQVYPGNGGFIVKSPTGKTWNTETYQGAVDKAAELGYAKISYAGKVRQIKELA
jgi:hypothetical protein